MEEMNPISRDFKGVWIPKKVWLDKKLGALEKLILACLCSYAGGGEQSSLGTGETCSSTRSKICHDLNISIGTFSKHLKNLVRYGYVKVEQIKENGRFSHNVYTLLKNN